MTQKGSLSILTQKYSTFTVKLKDQWRFSHECFAPLRNHNVFFPLTITEFATIPHRLSHCFLLHKTGGRLVIDKVPASHHNITILLKMKPPATCMRRVHRISDSEQSSKQYLIPLAMYFCYVCTTRVGVTSVTWDRGCHVCLRDKKRKTKSRSLGSTIMNGQLSSGSWAGLSADQSCMTALNCLWLLDCVKIIFVHRKYHNVLTPDFTSVTSYLHI